MGGDQVVVTQSGFVTPPASAVQIERTDAGGDARRPVALVTGTAQGLGSVIVEHLAREGFDVVANDLVVDDRLERVCEAARAAGARAAPLAFDISRTEDAAAFTAKAAVAFGSIDCLVNNAAVSVLSRGDILDVSAESFDRSFNVNLRGTFFLTQQVARWMLANKASAPRSRRRSIITISSVGVEHMVGRQVTEYCLAKSALVVMTKHFAVRLVTEGIDCYDVRPGMMQTSMTESSREKYDGLIANGHVPANRWGQLGEVAATIASLANGALRYSVGQTIHVDGGMALKPF